MWKKMLVGVVLSAVLSVGVVTAETAKQYRGPEDESPRAKLLPSRDGPVGVDRLISRGRQVEGESRWEFWWEMNRARFLREARRANAWRAAEGAGGMMFSLRRPDGERMTLAAVRTRIVPVLIARLRSPDPEERSIAALALGKSRTSAAFTPLLRMLEQGSGGDRRAAAVALGMLGDPLAVPALIKVMGKTGISPVERAYPALALGFLDSEAGGAALRAALRQSLTFRGRAIAEFQMAAVTALGLRKDRSAIPMFVRLLGNHANRSDGMRAAVANALGRIGDPAAVPALVRALSDHQVEVRRAATAALGVLAASSARGPITQVFLRDPDVQARGLAAVSLARIGGDGTARLLQSGLELKNPRAVRGFCALALGLSGDVSGAPVLRKLAADRSESSVAGAAEIALGMLRDPLAGRVLRAVAADRGFDADRRAYAVEALAMLGDPLTRNRIRDLAREGGAADVRRAGTLSLALFPGVPVGRTLLASLFEEGDPWVKGAAVAALGLTADRSVLDSLLGIVTSPGFPAEARKDALSALGSLAQAGRPSPVERLANGLNYRSAGRAVRAVAFLF